MGILLLAVWLILFGISLLTTFLSATFFGITAIIVGAVLLLETGLPYVRRVR